MKCPFCQQDLEEETFFGGRVFVSCNNPNCIISDWGGCSKQIITELIRTKELLKIESSEHDLCHDALVERTKELDRIRKVLDVALDKLKRIQKIYTNAPFNAPINYSNVCTDMYDVATEQIKDVK